MYCPVFVLTGLSGSGKSLGLNTLEDFGCEAIDNLPVSLCRLVILQKPLSRPLALGIDVRTRDFDSTSLIREINQLRENIDISIKLLFFEADISVIKQRYRETRRFHPLGVKGSLEARIREEKHILEETRKYADLVVDTSGISPPEMRKYMQEQLAIPALELTIHVLSFAYKNGIPYQADMVFDMRFLTNPHYQKEMKFLTGKAESIRAYLGDDLVFQRFLSSIKELLVDIVIPRLEQEGRREMVIAFGCTGGRHRSVFTAERITDLLRESGYRVCSYHRELN